MKSFKSAFVVGALLNAALQATLAQEPLPRIEALKIACYLGSDLKQLQGTAIPTDVDLKYPVAVRDGDYGAMVLPECKLNAEALSKAGASVAPVGQLWLRKLSPLKDDQPTPASKLESITIQTERDPDAGIRCALGFKQADSGPQLLIYSAGKEPILSVPLKKIQGQSQSRPPIQLELTRVEGTTGTLVIKIVGRFEGTFKVTAIP